MRWNLVGGLVLIILAYSMVRLTFQDAIPHKSMSLSREFYQSRQYLERALHCSSDPVIFTTLGKDYTLFSKVEPENVERAEFLLKMAKYMEPSRYYPRYLLMDLYNRIGKEEKEKEEAIGILGMDTKVESEAVDQIRELAHEKLNSTSIFNIKQMSETSDTE